MPRRRYEVRLEYIELENFKAIESARIALDGKSTVFFGINGTGKESGLFYGVFAFQ